MNWLRSREGWTSPAGLLVGVGLVVLTMLGIGVIQGWGQGQGFMAGARVVTEAATGPVFSPTSISDSILWLHGDAGVTADGSGKVSAWADQTSVGNDGAQATGANQPALIADALNGHDVLRFDGSSTYLAIADNGTIRPTSGITIFAVAKPSGTGAGDVLAKPLTRSGWAVPKYSYALSHQANNVAYGYASTTPSAATSVEATGTQARNKQAYASALVYDGAALKVFSNGVEAASSAATGDLNYDDATARDLLIGAAGAPTGLTRHFAGDVAEVIIYGRALTGVERAQVEVYLADKYGIYHASATWPAAYATDVQTEIAAQKWNKDQADAYVAFKATNPGLPTNGLAVWLDADSGVTADGSGKVSAWADKGVWGNHALQVNSGYQPVFVPNAWGDKDVIRFADPQFLRVADNSSLRPASGVTIIALAKSTGSGNRSIAVKALARFAGGWWQPPYNSYSLYYMAGNANHAYFTVNPSSPTGYGLNSNANRDDVPSISSVVYDGTALTIYNDGNERGTTALTGEINYDDSTAKDLAIGTTIIPNGLNQAFVGDIAEVIVYNRALSAGERQQAEGYLADKIGMYHPLATWPQAYDADTQAHVALLRLNKTQADAYVLFKSLHTEAAVPELGLAVWLKADAGVTADGSGKVSSWADQSPLGNNALQANAGNQPTLVDNALNGKKVLRFSGGHYLRIPDQGQTLKPKTALTIVAVSKPNVSANSTGLVVSRGLSRTDWVGYWAKPFYSYNLCHRPYNVPGAYILTDSTNAPDYNLGGSQVTDLRARVHEAVYDGATLKLYTDGVQDGSVPVTGNLVYDGEVLRDVCIGANNSFGVSNYLNGDVAEVLIYHRALSGTERQALELYLADKYALPHPDVTWPASFDSDTQAQIAANRWTKDQAQAYVDFKATSPVVPANGLSVWLKGDTGVTADGSGNVSAWADASPLANNAVQASTGNQPTQVAASLNGHTVIRFNGSHYLRIPDQSGLRPGAAVSVFAVAKPNTIFSGGSSAALVSRGLARDGGWGWDIPYYSYRLQWSANNVPGAYIATNPSSAAAYTTSGSQATDCRARVQSFIYNGSTLKVNGDGSEVASIAATGELVYDGPATFDTCIGANNTHGLGSFLNGDVAEVLIYNRALTPTERDAVELYLADKYGLFHPDATWPSTFDSDTQAQITAYQWTKDQAQAYVTFKGTTPAVPANDLSVWLKADVGVTADGSGKVSAWQDNAPLGNNAIQPSTGNQPVLVASAMSGKNVIRFDGASQYLRIRESSSIRPTTALTILAVSRANIVHGGTANLVTRGLSRGNWWGGWDQPYFTYNLSYASNNRSYSYVCTNPGSVVSTALGLDSQDLRPRLMGATYDGSALTTYSDGVQQTTTAVTGTFNYDDTVERELNLGVNTSYGFSGFFNGDISEVLVYRRALTTLERQQAEVYLSDKYGLPHANATWPAAYDTDTQTQIAQNKWTKDQADEYVAFKAGSPAVPAQDLAVWLKADSGITADGSGNVSKWQDQGFLKNDALQPTVANQPQLISGGLNGKNVLRFNGSSQFLALTDNTSLRPSSAISVFAVAKSNSTASGFIYTRSLSRTNWWGGWDAPFFTYSLSYGANNVSRGYVTAVPGTSFDTYGTTPVVDRWSSLGMVYDGSSLKLSGNGALQSTLTATGTLNYDDSNPRSVLIGVNFGTYFSGWLNADVAEIIVYNRAVTPTERTQVELYLSDKYGLYHPQATWPLAYSSAAQALINEFGWNKAETDAYVAFQNSAPPVAAPADLAVWLKADAGVTTSSGNVTAWTDSATGLYKALPANPSLPPVLVANALNGKPGIRFDGDRRLEIGNQPDLNPTDLTIIAVGKFDAPGVDQAPFITKANDARTAGWAVVQTAANSLGAWVMTPAQKAGTFAFARTYSTLTATYSGQSLATYINNVSTGTPVTITGTLGSLTEPLRIGGDGTRHLKGTIAEILVYRRALNPTERAAIDSYLVEKYGLYRPAATWITSYSAPMQTRIHAGKWTKDAAEAYTTWAAGNPGVPTEGIRMWLRADAGVSTTGTAPNLSVTTWQDQSFHGNSSAQATGARQPQLIEGAPGYFNGLPVLRFDGTGRFLEAIDHDTLHPEAVTIIAVTAPSVTATTPGNILSKPYIRSLNWGMPYVSYQFGVTAAGKPQMAATSTGYGEAMSSQTVAGITPQLIIGTYGSNGYTLYQNGGVSAAMQSFSAPISYTPAPTNPVIGTRSSTTTTLDDNFNGDIAELLVYDHVLTPTELADITAYLSTKYGIVTIQAPVISPAGGDYTSAVSATITCSTPGAVIRYTMDGSEPTSQSPQYSTALSITRSSILKARSYLTSLPPSPVVSATYYINDPSHENLYGSVNTDTRIGTGRVTPPQPLVDIDFDPETLFAPADPGDPPQIIILRPTNAVEVP